MSLTDLITNHPARSARFEFPIEASEATLQATSNFENNRVALGRAWSRTLAALPDSLPDLEWLFTRDGSLAGRQIRGRWFNDQSVPRLAAEKMLKQMVTVGSTIVFLAPTHAAQVRRALDILLPSHALVAVIPGEMNAGVIITCADFSADIAAGRLWLAVGPDWQEELKAILEGTPGLSPPTTMIRVTGLNAGVVEVISRPCDVLLATHARIQKHAASLVYTKPRSPQSPVRRVCVVTGAFSLWNDAAHLLGEAASRASVECVTVNSAKPTQASDLHFARSAEGCDAIVTANFGRADLPNLVADNVPWVTWVTKTSVPARLPASPSDRLVLADEKLRADAIAAGWPVDRLSVSAEPSQERSATTTASLIFDLRPVTLPTAVTEMSSHRLVWEQAESELIDQPFKSRGSVESFILACADRVGVSREAFPVAFFRDALVIPTFARAAAIELARHGTGFSIYGSGWDDIPELRSRYRGPIATADAWNACLASTASVLDVWPGVALHPARRIGRPVVALWGQTPASIATSCRTLKLATKPASVPPFDLDAVLATLNG